MASGILVNIKEEVTCPICLELLTEPLSLDCGHSFCQACITANNKESMVSQEGESSCPVCRISYQPGNLRPNRHVANIVEMLPKVKLSPEEEQERELCVRHGEKLLLFCKEDGRLICWLCERSQEHRGHHTFLMEEVAQEYQEQLQAALYRLQGEQQQAEKLEADNKEERTSWKDQIQSEIQCVKDYFKKLRGILDTEEQKELQKLEKEEKGILHDLEQAETELVQQSQLLRDLISDLEHRLQGPTMKMLQDVNGILERSKTFTLKKPNTVSKEQRRGFQAPDLSGILQAFNGLTEVRRYWVDITLRYSSKGNMVISENKRQLRYECRFNTDQDSSAILGNPVITSGKHYWEVDVSEKEAWILGAYGKEPPVTSNCQPKRNYWLIRLKNKLENYSLMEYASCSEHSKETLGWKPLRLKQTVPPHRVGVFLDYDADTISFFNITNHGFLICKFSSCSFPKKIYSYFSPLKCTAPMTLCLPGS